VQAFPDPPRRQAIVNVGRLVAPGGTLLAIAARHTADANTGPGLPWPLRREEVETFATDGLAVQHIEEIFGCSLHCGLLRARLDISLSVCR
jgi:hypothetical protein